MNTYDLNLKYLNIRSNSMTINRKNKERYNVLDNIKGILMFLVVFAQFLFNHSSINKHSLSHKIVNYIYCLHENSRSFQSITKLILIYIIFNYTHGFIFYKYKKVNFDFFILIILIGIYYA